MPKPKRPILSNSDPNEKLRSKWFRTASGRHGKLPPTSRLKQQRTIANSNLQALTPALNWDNIGPTNVGGRASCLVVHPTNRDKLWLGSAGGGVWRSDDAGQTWAPSWDNNFSQNIGALALDPSDDQVLYCGTGEANPSSGTYPGDGIYKSTDGGVTWLNLAGSQDVPGRIGSIAVDPNNPDHLFLGGYCDGCADDPNGLLAGLYESTDGGAKWQRLEFATRGPVNCHHVLFYPRGVLAAFSGHHPQQPLWRLEGGQWRPVPIDTDDGFQRFKGRISLAYCESQPLILYLLAADGKDVFNLYKTTDGGNAWSPVAEGRGNFPFEREGFDSEDQMNYNNTIAVDPNNPDRVVWGGVDLHISEDGGDTWQLLSRYNLNPDNPKYAHADHHDLAIVPVGAQGQFRVYDANDGGLGIYENGAWQQRANTPATTMFYDLDVSQQDEDYVVGGTQDNGTLLNTTNQSNNFSILRGADGGWAFFDPTNKNWVYSTTQNFRVFETELPPNLQTAGGVLVPKFDRELFPDLQNLERDIWMVFLAARPGTNQLVTGSLRPWIYDPQPTAPNPNWDSKEILDGSFITAIEVNRKLPDHGFFGTTNGGIFALRNGAITALSRENLPRAPILRIASGPNDESHIVCVFGSYGGFSHVYQSRDGGSTWDDIDNGRLPDVPHRAVVIPKSESAHILVATDVGVFRSKDRGGNWENLTGNLPFVLIQDLVYHDNTKQCFAATYGRGIWKTTL